MSSTVEVASRLGLSHRAVSLWAKRWYGPVGSGNPRCLEPSDLLVARAWQVLHGQAPRWDPRREQLCTLAEEAIRMRPRRWLLVCAERAETFDEAEDAAVALAEGWSFAWLIDLWSTP